MEGLRLRLKDVDIDRHVIVVRNGKGDEDRAVMRPRTLATRLCEQAGGGAGRHCQARHGAYVAPFLRHTFAAGWHRHPNGAGTAGSLRRFNDDDLHPCAQDRRRWPAIPADALMAV